MSETDDDETRGLARMAECGDAIVAGVDAHAATYVLQRALTVLDAWGVPAPERDAAVARLRSAADAAAQRVTGELRTLLALDPAEQTRTPLEIVRSLRREPTEVLAALGVGTVARDAFEERALPDDPYGLAPRTLADLGDENLGPLQLAWGVGKATVLRARARHEPVDNLSMTSRGAERERNSLGTITGKLTGAWRAWRERAKRDGGSHR